jgi:predicted chitinase
MIQSTDITAALSAVTHSSDLEEVNALKGSVFDRITEMGIRTVDQWAAFLGNLHHESAGFTRFEEGLYYSTEKRLMQVWPSRFKTRASARKCVRNPKALAMKVYNGRMGNRMGTTDGWDFRGSGMIQTTGRNNFTKLMTALGMNTVEDPGILRSEHYEMWIAAAYYFTTRRYKGKSLLQLADEGQHKAICRAINGGTHGLADRKAKTNLYKSIITKEYKRLSATLMKVGSRGADVKGIQYKLRSLGYKIYKIDGVFGRKTEAVIKEFQSDNGLATDGLVGGNTWLAIETKYEMI